MAELFDERLSLRRLTVALRRHDWRMFEYGLERLNAELTAGSPFRELAEWQSLARSAGEAPALPDELREALGRAMSRMLAREAVVSAAIGAEAGAVGATAPPDAPAPEAIALVAAWGSSLDEPRVLRALRTWLEADRPDESRRAIAKAVAEGAGLADLAERANFAAAGAACGLGVDGGWTPTFWAGLARAIAREAGAPPVTQLLDLIGEAPVSVLTAEPGAAWERHYGDVHWQRADAPGTSRHRLAKLAGSLDAFLCPTCGHSEQASVSAVALACAACGAPAWPLVAPVGHSPYFPRALRDAWAFAAKLLRESTTWVLLEPPPPGDDPVLALALDQLAPGKRVIVVTDAVHHEPWRIKLAAYPGVTAVTSRGPADEVLRFLLSGAPEPASAAPPTPSTAASPLRKKPRR